ncbi:FAD-binding oxidoreductase [Bradyrhizobium sp. 179]|nr:FAD-binding oxidoreductase [Bradyrhizobium sp. 179]
MLTDDLDERLRAIVGIEGMIERETELERYCVSFDSTFRGSARYVVRPSCTAQVSAIVAACRRIGVPIVPQGGNTGLAGGAQPTDPRSVIISLERMQALRDIDPRNDTVTVEAGMTLASLQAHAAGVDRLFPLSLASEGSCQVGGNLSTSAGGTQVLRYGNMRSLALGIEVVFPDGRVWDGLRGLRKDSTGYDLKQLFIGAEGTLGIITAATLRLFPRPRDVATALVGVPSPAAALDLLHLTRAQLGEGLNAFELMRRECLQWVLVALPGSTSPFAEEYPWYSLIEATGQGEPGGLRTSMERALSEAMDKGLVLDGVLANSEAQRRSLWALREGQAEAQKAGGAGIKHDVSVPVSRVPEFIALADAALAKAFPGIRPFAFGHIGDGNIHYNPMPPADVDPRAFAERREEINRVVHDIVANLGGSISAEHGIGQLRLSEIAHYKSPTELSAFRALKKAFDPENLMNPGKLLT